MALDFNQDIAPLRQQYFPMLTGAREFDRNLAYDQEVLSPLRQRVVGLQESIIGLKRQDMLYQSQKLALEQKREDMRMQREQNEAVPLIEQRLAEIETSDETPSQKMQRMREYAVKNVGMFDNKRASTLFNIYEKSIANQAAEQGKIQAQRNADANIYKSRYVGTPLYNDNIFEGLRSGDNTLGQVSEMATQYKRALEQKEDLLSRREEIQEEEKSRQEESIKATTGILKELQTSLNSVELVDDPEHTPTAKYGDEDYEEPPKVLKNEDRSTALMALALARNVDPNDPEEMAGILDEFGGDDLQLYNAAKKEAITRRLELSGVDMNKVSEQYQSHINTIDAAFQ